VFLEGRHHYVEIHIVLLFNMQNCSKLRRKMAQKSIDGIRALDFVFGSMFYSLL